MPWTKIECISCGMIVPLSEADSHFEGCGSLPTPYIKMLKEAILSDTRHSFPRVTTTSVMTCPRAILLPHFTECTINPLGRLPLVIGTMWHNALAKVMVQDYKPEQCTCAPPFPVKAGDSALQNEIHEIYGCGVKSIDSYWHMDSCYLAANTWHGTIGGIPLSGQTDAIRHNEDGSISIFDWKTRSAYKSKMIHAELEDIVQLNINRILAEQNGFEVSSMHSGQFLWNTILYEEVPFMTEDEILEVRPKSGSQGFPPTIGEILQLLHTAIEAIKSGADPKQVISDLPMVGSEMYKSSGTRNMCSQYCEVALNCYPLQ